MKKTVFLGTIIFAAGMFSFAQTAVKTAEEEAIMLPDVSTVISGGAPKAGKSAVPDYSEVLPKRQTSELVPKLPDAVRPMDSVLGSAAYSSAREKSIYAEGLAGLGYPGFFIGNFSVYNQTGPNPFKIEFGHETLNGYAGSSMTSGFFDKNTLVSAEKTFSFSKGKFVAGGLYNSLNDGLQNRVENVSGVTRDLMQADGKLSINLPKGFSFSAELDASWYRRYSTVVGEPSVPIPLYASNLNLLDVIPSVCLDFERAGFFASASAGYNLYADVNSAFEDRILNRADFGIDAGFKNDFFKVYGNVHVLLGNLLGSSALVPFTVGTDFKIPVSFSLRPLTLSVFGGLDSFAPKIHSIEMENTFSAFSVLPGETTDWYSGLDFALPGGDSFTFTLSGEFRKTLGGNGTWTCGYNDEGSLVSGLYTYSAREMFQVNTKIGFLYMTKAGTFGGEWKSSWADRASNEPSHFVLGTYSFQSKASFFTLDASLGFSPADDDMTPLADFEAAFKVSSAVRLAFTGTDIVKLVSGKARKYAGSYISRSGSLGLLAKFVF